MALKHREEIERALTYHRTIELARNSLKIQRDGAGHYFLSVVSPDRQVYNGNPLIVDIPRDFKKESKVIFTYQPEKISETDLQEPLEKMEKYAGKMLKNFLRRYKLMTGRELSREDMVIITNWRVNQYTTKEKKGLIEMGGRIALNIFSETNMLPSCADFFYLNELSKINPNASIVCAELRNPGLSEMPLVIVEQGEPTSSFNAYVTPWTLRLAMLYFNIDELKLLDEMLSEGPYRILRGTLNLEDRTLRFN